MVLSFENIAHYLLEKGLIDLESVIRGAFSVRDQSSRNANYAVNREYSPSYLLKQVRAHDQEKRETLRIEATCYWLANNDEGYQTLLRFLPQYHDYDYLHHILVLELLPDVQNLHEYFRQVGFFPIFVAEKLADLLASFHTHEPKDIGNQRSFSLFKKRKPWVFTLAENSLSDWLNNPGLGNAERQSVKLILENQEFMEHLGLMGEEWELKSLIHGDVKFPNFLIDNFFTPGSEPEVRLIDWELADIGDPLWDVAAVVQNYLMLWVASEVREESRPGEAALVDLRQVQPSIAAFWRRYVHQTHWDEAMARQYLEKTVRYTALKLVHTCFESVQGVNDMSLYGAKILQLSLNLLRRPEEAISEALGI